MTLICQHLDLVTVLTISNVASRNALDLETIDALSLALEEMEGNRVVVITGSKPAFCSGANLNQVQQPEFSERLHDLLRKIACSPQVTIAAIDGPALGAGAQVALSCDLRVATRDSVIGIPAARLGLVVNHWTVERLFRECSFPVARAMLLAGQIYSGEELAAIKAIQKIGTLADAISWAKEISQLAPLSIAGHKAALNASVPDPHTNELVSWIREKAWSSDDVQEGRIAFNEKRAAKFVGS